VQITLNGQAHDATEATSLHELVRQVSDRQTGIAVALNSTVIPRSSWPDTAIAEGDRIDVVTAVQGG
jgi:sulfur carrier protein